MIKELAEHYPVRTLLEALEVSRSGYYAWLPRAPTQRRQANEELLMEIKAVHADHQERYGSPRITEELQARGWRCNRKRVARLMRCNGLRARRKRAFCPRTTDSAHDHPVAPNNLPQRPCEEPNQVWVADLTYVRTGEGWLYLAGIMDLYSRVIKGWDLQTHMREDLPLAALEKALATHGSPKLHHSDRGSQYAGAAYRKRLSLSHIEASMSRRANCYDNAAMESFWGTLKTELFGSYVPATREEARRMIFEYIELYYNRRRIHSAINYKTPLDFEASLEYQHN